MRIQRWALLCVVLVTLVIHVANAQEPPMPGVANPKPPGPIKPPESLETPSAGSPSLEELML